MAGSVNKRGHGLGTTTARWRPAFHRFHTRIKAPELMKPWQLRLAAQRGCDVGEVMLAATILNRAIEDVLRGSRRLAEDALQWFRAEPAIPAWLYSFESICDNLELPANEIRRDVEAWWEERCRNPKTRTAARRSSRRKTSCRTSESPASDVPSPDQGAESTS